MFDFIGTVAFFFEFLEEQFLLGVLRRLPAGECVGQVDADALRGLQRRAERFQQQAQLQMATTNGVAVPSDAYSPSPEYAARMERYELQKATDLIWDDIEYCDNFIQQKEPFKKIKTDPDGAKADIKELLIKLNDIAQMLKPFMPKTSEKILEALKDNLEINTPLFPRL